MVCPHDLSVWPGNFSAWAAHSSVLDAGRHFLRSAFVHGTGADRTKIRHGTRASAGDNPGVCATARARIFPIFHLAAFQTHTGKRHSEARTFARKRALTRQPESPRILERGGEGTAIISWAKYFGCSRKKAGAIPPTAAGTTGTFKFTAISGGASRFKPSPNITAQENV